MKKILILLLITFFGFSCDGTYQYNVYVKNTTGELLRISYKTLNDQRGIIEEIVDLQNGESLQIISTINLNVNDKSKQPCNYVAEYVTAYMRDTIPSKINWCDDRIQYDWTDIGQAEFYIHYTRQDFEIPESEELVKK